MLRVSSLPLLLLLALGAQACTESATATFVFTSEATPTGIVSFNNISGSVHLTRGPAGGSITGTVRVTASGFDSKGQARAAADDVRLVENGTPAELVIDVTVPREARGKVFDVDLELQVPDDVRVEVATDNGSIRVENLAVTVLDTTNGPIDMRFTSGNALAVTNNGTVVVEGHQGDLDVRTTNAPIDLISIQGNLAASTVNARIDARVTPNPSNGDVRLATTGGPIQVTIPRATNGRLTGTTTAPGLVFIEQTLDYARDTFGPGFESGFLGSGQGVLIDARTTVSDIVIDGR